MATSYKYFKKNVKNYLISKFPETATILDVGAGCGTYYNLLHDCFKTIHAVEVFKPNIDNYELEKKYNAVFNADIKDFEYGFYAIIIFGDIIEHLTVEEAQKVLKYAYDRCDELIVAVPYEMEQDICEDNVYEIHKQPDLTPENVLERYPMLKLLYKNSKYGYYVKDDAYEES
jgi:predicted RNA methylase